MCELVFYSATDKLEIGKYPSLDGQVDPNIKTSNSFTALIMAFDNRHLSVARLLVHHGADVSAQDRVGRTAIDYANYKNPGTHAYMGCFLRNKMKGPVLRNRSRGLIFQLPAI